MHPIIDNFYLIDHGSANFYQSGQALLEQLDQHFLSFIEKYPLQHWAVSTLVDEQVLRKSGILSAFPQYLTVAAPFGKEYCSSLAQKNSGKTTINTSQLQYQGKFLCPAACLNLYPMLREKAPVSRQWITTKTKVYRREQTYADDLSRLWEFTVRELLIVGQREFVLENLTQAQEKIMVFARQIHPEASAELASDSFFPSRENKIRSRLQLANRQKTEILLPLNGRRIAVSSLNYHGSHFSRAFDFTGENQIETGCIGFGLERWAATCLHNANPFSGSEER